METLLDYTTLERCARSLATRKAPGPDGVFNEVFKYGPTSLLRCVHSLLRRFVSGGEIPAPLAESSTILLYKKNDPRDLGTTDRLGWPTPCVNCGPKCLHPLYPNSQNGTTS